MKAVHKNQQERGVALIFFMMIFGVMLSFILLVMNSGVIVYNKIQLQTATDLAAYAGASVQASYLGNATSGENSLAAINIKIRQRYGQLIQDMNEGYNGVWPMMLPDAGSCMAACMAANTVNAQRAVGIFKSGAADIEELHREAHQIISEMPLKAREAAVATLRLNIPEFSEQGKSALGALGASTTNNFKDILKQEFDGSDLTGEDDVKNATLAFSSDYGAYLANVVSNVPHAFPYFGPICYNQFQDTSTQQQAYYCIVNGSGVGGGTMAYLTALAAYTRSFVAGPDSGNTGTIEKLMEVDAPALKTHFIEDPHKPKPYMVAAGEWFPATGAMPNLENVLGIAGSLFPKRTRLVAISAAEPFGSSLTLDKPVRYGVRLQSIRKLLLDQKMQAVREDFPGLFDYMAYVGPKDEDGNDVESVEETIQRFLH